MFKFAIPAILIGISITGFLTYTNPTYKQVMEQRDEVASYNKALDNSKSLEAERDRLTAEYNAIDKENLAKLEKMLPDNVDNIRLILEIGEIARPYGMVLKDVKYDTITKKDSTSGATNATTAPASTTTEASKAQDSNKEYGAWNMEFSAEGTYSNFLNFLKDLESNLRIVDISSISFSSDAEKTVTTDKNKTPQPNDFYKYSFKIKTYWLKN